MNKLFNEKFYELAQKIEEKGGRLYVVGGSVRDMLLNQEPHDIDYCVTGIDENTLSEIANVSRVQGSFFPVVIIDGSEVALARTERKRGIGHKGFDVETDKRITIEQDLARRDITINSMAVDVLTNELVDPFGGADDLKNGIIRNTTDAFREDPLRVYRVARFASKFGFTVANDTILLINSMKDELSSLAPERVLAEMRNSLRQEHPERFFEVLKEAGVLDVHFKELADLIGVEQPIEYHPEGDAFVHTMEVLQRTVLMTQNAEKNVDEEMTRFCALVHDSGKATTPRELWPHHYGHEERGEPLIHAFCKRIRIPKNFEKAGKLVSRVHMKAGKIESIRPGSKAKLFEEIYKSRSISFRGVEIVAIADSKDLSINFAKLAEETMKITASEEMIEKCKKDGILDYEKLKGLLLQKRIKFIKEREIALRTNNLSSIKNSLIRNVNKDN